MIPVIQTLQQSFARVKFETPDIKNAVTNFLEVLSADLTGAGYDAGEDTEEAAKKITAALDEADENSESLSGLDDVAREGATLEDEDEA